MVALTRGATGLQVTNKNGVPVDIPVRTIEASTVLRRLWYSGEDNCILPVSQAELIAWAKFCATGDPLQDVDIGPDPRDAARKLVDIMLVRQPSDGNLALRRASIIRVNYLSSIGCEATAALLR